MNILNCDWIGGRSIDEGMAVRVLMKEELRNQVFKI